MASDNTPPLVPHPSSLIPGEAPLIPPGLPLAGIRVIDLTDEKGELCARLLADMGADVVRVEPPGGSRSRRLSPFAPDGVTSLAFAFRNANKRAVTLDITDASEHERLHRLLAGADILVESFTPGYLASVGLAPTKLTEQHPRLIVTSVTDFGQTGPYAGYAGSDMAGFAMGGMMYRSGVPDRPPLAAPSGVAYGSTDVTAAFATVMALFQRLTTGRGQHLDVSVMESVANMSDWSLPSFSHSGAFQKRSGTGPLYPYYRCADGWVRVILLTRRQWASFREWLGDPDVLRDAAWEQPMFRATNMDVIAPFAAEVFRDRPKIAIAEEGQRRGIPVTPVLSPAEVLHNDHTAARATFIEMEVAPGIESAVASGFYHSDGHRIGPRTRAPLSGEHDAAIDAELAATSGPASPTPKTQHPTPAAQPPVPSPHPSSLIPHPFSSLRVLDFGIGGVGVEVGRLFAEYGADVIKVESASAPDFIRVVSGAMMSPPFASSSRSKRGLGINLRTPEGKQILHKLVRLSDIVIENSGTGVMERLGAGYEDLRANNPRIIMISSQIAGRTGPWRGWTGYGPSTHPLSGLSALWNYPDITDRPGGSQNIYPDHLAGRLGALIGTAALLQRERTGCGSHVDAAQFEVPIGLLGDVYLKESLSPGAAVAVGNVSDRGAPWGVYPCKAASAPAPTQGAGDDAWCVVNVDDDAQWQRLCTLMGNPAWAGTPVYATAAGRMAERATIDEHVSAWTATYSAKQLMELLQSQGIPAGVVQSPADQMADPHLTARGYQRRVEQPPYGTLVFEGPAFRGTALAEPIIRAAPELGEHTRAICRDLLEMTEPEIDALVAKGVLDEPKRAAVSAGS
ncbi:MAG: CoA transferase [Chloroflexi bacterium]|nr:CoA transferase [Chloroflexota bacterium]